MSDTIIWITGATEGIGLALAQNAPYPGARIVNLSRRKHPDYESVHLDLTDPTTWDNVRAHMEQELAVFKGRRAIFIQNAYWADGHGVLEKVDPAIYRKSLYANVMAPLAMGEMFVRACRPGYESGLVLMSAGAAACCLEGLSTYGPGKIALEHWAQIVDKELGRAPGKPWVVAMRAGGTLTGPVKRLLEKPDPTMPNQQHIIANAKKRLDPASAARHIWAALPPPPGVSLVAFAPVPEDPELRFEGKRMKQVDVPGWKLVYR